MKKKFIFVLLFCLFSTLYLTSKASCPLFMWQYEEKKEGDACVKVYIEGTVYGEGFILGHVYLDGKKASPNSPVHSLGFCAQPGYHTIKVIPYAPSGKGRLTSDGVCVPPKREAVEFKPGYTREVTFKWDNRAKSDL